jgi:YHS domain-containing protein
MKKTIVWMTAVLLSLGLVAMGCSSSKSAEEKKEQREDMAEQKMKDKAKDTAEKGMEEAKKAKEEDKDEGMAEAEGTETAEAEAAIDGYCPVAYKMAGKPVKGKAEFAVEHDGKTWYLANEKAMKAFEEKPGNYEVKYAGWCAAGLAMGKQVEADPTIFAVHNEKIYLFSTEDAKKKFMAKADEMAKKAEKNYTAMKSEGGAAAEGEEGMEKGEKEGAEEGM